MTQPVVSRRTLLAAAAALAAVPAGVVAATGAHAQATPDADTLNTLLAVEHAAIYDLATLGAHLGAEAREQVRMHYDGHRMHRDALAEAVARLGGSPALTEPAYRLPGPASRESAPSTVVLVEQAVVAAYHQALGLLRDPAALTLCAAHFVDEARHLAVSRLASAPRTGVAAADAFVTGA